MNAEKRRKLLDLEAMRRRLPHVSQRALSATLKDVKQHGLPELDDTKHIREARELLMNEKTPYGPISVTREVTTTEGGVARFRMANPLALLYLVFFYCAPFAGFVEQRFAECPQSLDNPWNIVLYCDEVHPGDQLGGKKLRKFHAIYFSFKEFGIAALSHENMWFTIATVRTQVVNTIPGGMSKIFSLVMKELFVDGPLSDLGLLLEHNGRSHRLFAKLGYFIQDGAAHKQTWHCKGDAGCKLCVLCRNVFSLASEVVGEDGEELLRCNVKKRSELDLATSADLRYAVRRINELHDAPDFDPTEFEVRQKALGFTWSPYNLLGDVSMDPHLDVPSQFFHDWMHMIFVGGVFNLTLHYFLEAIKEATRSNVYAQLKDYVNEWTLPKRFNLSGKLGDLFENAKRISNVKAGIFKCAASEGLSLYFIISHWALTVLPEDTCPAERKAFLALCDIIDCMRATAYITVAGAKILQSVELFLDLYDKAFGLEWSTPKFHWMLHFGDYADRFGELISCWPLERKHKTPKSYGADVRDTRVYEQSVMHEVICKHIAELMNPDTFDFLRCGLFKPQKAKKDFLEWLADGLELPVNAIQNICMQSHTARHSVQVVCSVGDCILYNDPEGNMCAGEVWSNFEIDGELAVLVQVWAFISIAHGASLWEIKEDLYPVFSKDILDVVSWTKHTATRVKILMPAHA